VGNERSEQGNVRFRRLPRRSTRHDPHKSNLNCWRWGPQGFNL